MRFTLIDKITELVPGESIVAVKNLSLAEEYLADHFPGFPVMPGVLMLEAIVQAGAWLIRVTNDFDKSVVILKEARNVKFGSMVQPGKQATIRVTLLETSEDYSKIKGEVICEDDGEAIRMVLARVTLAHFSLADRHPSLKVADERMVQHLREMYDVLHNHDLSAGARSVRARVDRQTASLAGGHADSCD